MDSTRRKETKRILDNLELECQFESKKRELREVREHQKKLLELKDKTASNMRMTENLESQLEVRTKQLDVSNKERDKLERDLATHKSELVKIKKILELERQERRELESKALNLIKGAKRKWEMGEREKIAQLNKHIESQTLRITELCTSNNEMSSRLQRAECELETANAELNKLRVFQTQQKESLSKLRELNRQSTQGVENKLEQIANRAHNQLAELRTRLDVEMAKSSDLEAKLRSEQDTNHCRQSRLNVALELTQSELKDCQEELRSLKATIPARDAEMETLKKQLSEKTKQLENTINSEQYLAQMTEHMERLKLENDQLRQQLESTKSDLSDTIVNLEKNEALALNLEKATHDKTTLEQRLQRSLEKEEEHLKKVSTLEELLRRLEQNVKKLETENARLRRKTKELPSMSYTEEQPTSTVSEIEISMKPSTFDEQIKRLEEQLKSAKETAATERQNARQAQLALWKKEKELSDANLDKRIATREAKSAEEKIKKLEEDKQKLQERLNRRVLDEEEKIKKLMKELDSTKSNLTDVNRECTRHKSQAESAQRALTQANMQIEELQSSSAMLRRELDSARKQLRSSQERVDALKQENDRLLLKTNKHGEETNSFEAKLEKLQEELNAVQVNNELLKETCTVLEEQLTDYERLTSDHEFRENTLIQEKMKLQKDLESVEARLREAIAAQNEEKTMRMVAERAISRLESETSDIEEERNNLASQRDQYKKMAQQLSKQVAEHTAKCGQLECDLTEMRRSLETARAEARVVKEECSQHLTKLHELKETNLSLMEDLQDSVDQGQELRERVMELEGVLEEMRQFYNERELKAGSTQQQQTKLIDYLQLKLEECSKKKKTVCDKIFGSKQKENIPPIGTAMPVGYRELENQLEQERAKVKALTEQLLTVKATKATAPVLSNPSSPDPKGISEFTNDYFNRQPSLQRMRHNIPHRFNVSLPMRTGKCATCMDSIQFGRRAAICSECQIMAHLKCSLSVPATCGIPGDYARKMRNNWRNSNESVASNVDSIQTLALDEPDTTNKEQRTSQKPDDVVIMESWVKVPGRSKSSWERKYLRLEGCCLCTYEHEPTPGMSPISRLDLSEKEGYAIIENVDQPEVAGTAKSDLPFILRVESNATTTCWPTTRLDIMALSQKDKKDWLKSLMCVPSKAVRVQKYQRLLRLAKNQLDLNCAVELNDENILLLGAEDGLFSYRSPKSSILTAIRGVRKVHQLTLHPHLGLALMIAGEDRQLVSCDLRQLKNNAIAAECSRPAINTKTVLTENESCHLYQVQGEMLCAATATHVILMNWIASENSGEFIGVREFETQEPCSCVLFTANKLIIGCNKFFQIDIRTYNIEEFPEDDDNSVKGTITGVARLGIFPVCVLNISEKPNDVEILLCYNEFGVFVDENGKRTRSIDPTWSHLPFAFAYRNPYLFIIHFSSVEVIKIDAQAFKTSANKPEKTLIELNNPRFLGLAGDQGIYVASVNSTLEVLKIDGSHLSSGGVGSSMSLDTLSQADDDTSEFSFTSSLMEVLDGQTKRDL